MPTHFFLTSIFFSDWFFLGAATREVGPTKLNQATSFSSRWWQLKIFFIFASILAGP